MTDKDRLLADRDANRWVVPGGARVDVVPWLDVRDARTAVDTYAPPDKAVDFWLGVCRATRPDSPYCNQPEFYLTFNRGDVTNILILWEQGEGWWSFNTAASAYRRMCGTDTD